MSPELDNLHHEIFKLTEDIITSKDDIETEWIKLYEDAKAKLKNAEAFIRLVMDQCETMRRQRDQAVEELRQLQDQT